MSSERSPDIIRWVIDCMMAHDKRITADLAITVEAKARAEWGRQTVYVAEKSPDARVDPEAVRRDLANRSRPVGEVARRHGISRATVYRLIKRD